MEKPFFSVVIPTFNRPGPLTCCLAALAVQDYPARDFEVIVVDDGSRVPLQGAAALFADRMTVRFLTQAHGGVARARNTGMAAAQGKFLAFTDDDCLPAPDWLSALAAQFAATPEDGLGGPLISSVTANSYSWAFHLILSTVYAYFNTPHDAACMLAAANLALPAEGLRALGGFDEGFTCSEDREVCDRWLARGGRLRYVPAARVYHRGPETFGQYCRRYFGYGRGAYRFFRVRAARGSGSLWPDIGFYAGFLPLLRRVSARDRQFSRTRLVFLLFMWQVMNVSGFFWEWLGARLRLNGKA